MHAASQLGVPRTCTTHSAANARQQLLPATVAATALSKAGAITRSAVVAITRSATAARRREVVVMAATLSSAAVAASPPSIAGVITLSATASRRREAEVDSRTCVNDLARYTEFLREEEERLVEHAKSLTAAVAAAHAASEARNQEIYEENHRFKRGRLERQRAFEVNVAEAATTACSVLQLSSSSVGSSSSASY